MLHEFEKVQHGEAPTDRMYGLVELRRKGHDVDFSDARFVGRMDRLRRASSSLITLFDLSSLVGLHSYDVVVAKDAFASVLTASALLSGTRIVYLDAMFRIPTRLPRRLNTILNIRMAHGQLAYSTAQVRQWMAEFRLPGEHFRSLPYGIDVDFYRARATLAPPVGRPYVLAIGRDTARDFQLLFHAVRETGLGLTLVTLPYLLRGLPDRAPGLDIRMRVTYEELFQLYAHAAVVAVPLKAGTTYPSGIRAMLEALLLRRPVVATRTAVLEEYVPEANGVVYVDPGDSAAFRRALVDTCSSDTARHQAATCGHTLVSERYGMSNFADAIEHCLEETLSS